MVPVKMNRVIFSADGQSVFGCGDGFEFFIWNVETGLQVRCFGPILQATVTNLAVALDGRYVASCHQDVALWDTLTGKFVRNFKLEGSWILDAAISPDNRLLITVGEDKLVRLWDLEKGTELHRFEGHNGTIKSIRFSMDGKYAVSAGQDKTIHVWKI